MTDAQLLTLTLGIVIPLSMLIYSNSRITEAKETLRAEMKTLGVELRAEIAAGFERLSNEIRSLDARWDARLKQHELEYHR